MGEKRSRGLRKWVNLLLVIPCIAALWTPFYNSVEPRYFGIPFFYMWQLVWIWLGAGITWVVYVVAWRGGDE